MLPHIVAIWVGSCHRNCMSSGWLVAHRGPVLPVSSRHWNELPDGDRRARVTYATAELDGNVMLGPLNPRALIQLPIVGHIGNAARPLVSSWDRRCNRERVALLKTTSPWLVLCRLMTLRRIASVVALVQSLTAGTRRHQVRRNEVDVMS